MDTMTPPASSLGSAQFKWPTAGEYGTVPLDTLVPNPNQPRQFFDDEELLLLANTMKGAGTGQREIVTVSEFMGDERTRYAPPSRYIIVSGERRWRAAKLAQLPELEIRVKAYATIAERMLDAYMLNENRVGLSDIENSDALANLAKEFGWKTQSEIAAGTGKELAWVQQHMALQNLTLTARAMMSPDLPEKERFTRQVGVFLSRQSPEDQNHLTTRIPKEYRTAAQRVNWMTDELRRRGVHLPTRKREPRRIRGRLYGFIERVSEGAQAFNRAADFGDLFENTAEYQAKALVDDMHASLRHYRAMVDRVDALFEKRKAGPIPAAPLGDGAVQKPVAPVETPKPQSSWVQPLHVSKPVPKPTPKPAAVDTKKAAADFLAKRNGGGLPPPAPKPVEASKPRPEPPRPPAPKPANPVRTQALAPPRSSAQAVSKPPTQRLAPAPTPKKPALPEDAPLWQKKREITVNRIGDTGRVEMATVGLEKYVRLWELGVLEFQQKKKEKPEHLPSLEEVLQFLGEYR